MKILSKIKTLLSKKAETIKPIAITSDLIDRLSCIFAYRLMMESGNYYDEVTFRLNKRKCKEVLGMLCQFGYQLTKDSN